MVGGAHRMVRALFELAREMAPSFIFIDEVDSLLSERGGAAEGEASRKLKTEFLVQFDGVGAGGGGDGGGALTVMAATNRPQEIDEAARRRFVKRVYIPLPEEAGRGVLLRRLLGDSAQLSSKQWAQIARATEHFSGVRESVHACMQPQQRAQGEGGRERESDQRGSPPGFLPSCAW